MPGAKLRHLPYYARIITSIMPGQAWRDTGHKARALCPVSTEAIKLRQTALQSLPPSTRSIREDTADRAGSEGWMPGLSRRHGARPPAPGLRVHERAGGSRGPGVTDDEGCVALPSGTGTGSW